MSQGLIIGGTLLAGYLIYRNSQPDIGEEKLSRVLDVKNLDPEVRKNLYKDILNQKVEEAKGGVFVFSIVTSTITIAVGVVLLIQKLRNISQSISDSIEFSLRVKGVDFGAYKKEINDISGDSNLDKLKKYANDKLDSIAEKFKNLKEDVKESKPYQYFFSGKEKVIFQPPSEEKMIEEPKPEQSMETATLNKTQQEQALKIELADFPEDTLNQSEVQVSDTGARQREGELIKTNEYPRRAPRETSEIDKRVVYVTNEKNEIKFYMNDLQTKIRGLLNLIKNDPKLFSENTENSNKNKLVYQTLKKVYEDLGDNIFDYENLDIVELERILNELEKVFNIDKGYFLMKIESFIILKNQTFLDMNDFYNDIENTIEDLKKKIVEFKEKFKKEESSCNIF